eukprot:g9293.t1
METGEVFISVPSAARHNQTSADKIRYACIFDTAASGFHWKYEDELTAVDDDLILSLAGLVSPVAAIVCSPSSLNRFATSITA